MTEEIDVMEAIAVIGMAGRFPGAKNVSQFWENLANGIESISRYSDEDLLSRGVSQDIINNPNYVKAGTILDNAQMFDASFFGYSQHEAELMDPQQRILLEIAWEALESAGYNPDVYEGSIGVFAGTSGNDYRKQLPADSKSITSGMDSFEVMMGNEPDFLTTRISYKLNLKGPSFSIQTACSTSLVAVHQACQHLLTYQCDMALSGGVCVRFPQGHGYLYQEGVIWSPDGHCRPFDSKANGTLFGNGAGLVVLKRLSEALEDNDNILAVIKGSAINNDGSLKAGFTAPSVAGQAEVISTAIALSEVKADSISYIETHGTGTPLGDPIEVEALTQSFREETSRNQFCAIGSVKSNIGHLDAAAGVTGLIKTILMLKHKKIPPTLHYTTPNPNIDFSNSPFYVNNHLQEWKNDKQPCRAGVSSFGIGGTNAHVILEEAPPQKSEKSKATWHILPFSAKTEAALNAQISNFSTHIKTRPDLSLADTAYTLQAGRKHFNFRSAIVCKNIQDINTIATRPAHATAARDVIFMFSGQDSQYANMCRDLYSEFSVFKKNIDLCSEILLTHMDVDIRNLIYPADQNIKKATVQLQQTSITQPVLFTIEYALAKLWNHFGIFPTAMVGHSIGEYVAACISGVFSLEDALKIVAARGRLMQSCPPGSMLAVPLSKKDVQPYLSQDISLAVLNSSSMSVVSGETDQIEALSRKLAENGISGRILHTSHAFHSSMMDPIIGEFKQEVEKTQPSTPQIPFVSTLTGKWITNDQATDPHYWAQHLRQPVQFSKCTGELLNAYPQGIMLEVGAGQALTMLSNQHPFVTQKHFILASTRRPVQRDSDVRYFLHSLSEIWSNGVKIKWEKLHMDESRNTIPLPTYPFERKSYWMGGQIPHKKSDPVKKEYLAEQSLSPPPDANLQTGTEKLLARIWLSLLPGIHQINRNNNFLELGGNSLQAVQMMAKLKKAMQIDLPLATLVETPKLKDLAKTIDLKVKQNSAKNTEWRSLVALQPKGSKPPLFLMHGIGGNVLNYKIFIPYLGKDQPIYGLQARGLNGLAQPFSDIKSMARYYISEIKSIQPHGPYCLGGGSLGGTVALEMAQQLMKEGETIAFLVMFDTQGPNSLLPSNQTNTFSKYLQKISKLSFKDKIQKFYATSMFFVKKIILYVQVKGFQTLKHPIPYKLRYRHIEKIHQKAWMNYRPEKYNGRLTLFRAFNKNNKANYDREHGWAGLAKDLKVIEMPGEHATFIEETGVGEKLANLLMEAHNL